MIQKNRLKRCAPTCIRLTLLYFRPIGEEVFLFGEFVRVVSFHLVSLPKKTSHEKAALMILDAAFSCW